MSASNGEASAKEPLPGSTRNDFSGEAADVIQAQVISGGVHIHHVDRQQGPMPRQLPGDVRGFVNRTADIQRLDAVLAKGGATSTAASICVIAGTAGVGKTSLAVHWAHMARGRFPDGQLYVNLRGYDPGEPVTPMQSLERFLLALGVSVSAIPTEIEACAALYRSLVADKRLLIVLDNAATVGQVRLLLPGTEGCLTLVTSRNRLSGLVSRDGAHRVTLDVFPEAEAVELLRATTEGYRGGDSEVDVAELARLCARLPLALRIAAERAAARPRMPLAALIQDLRDESSLWDALSSDDDEEADTVRTVFAWSYRALPPDAARMFRLLGLHPGPDFSLDAAAALASVSHSKARQLLDTLVGAHLLEQTVHERFQFHDLLRAYAIDQATSDESSEQRHEALARVCDWYLRAMGAAAAVHDAFYSDDWGVDLPPGDHTGLPVFSDLDQAMAWFSVETENLVAASRAADIARLDEIAWKLPALLRTPYLDRHPVGQWLRMGVTALAAARRSGDLVGQAITLTGLGVAYRQAQRVSEAIDSHFAALTAAREAGDRRQEVAALVLTGHAQRRGRQLEEAYQSYEQGLAVANEASLALWLPWAMIGMAEALLDAGRLEESRTLVHELIRIIPRGQYPGIEAEWSWVLASIERESGESASAVGHIQEALEIAHNINNTIYEGEYETELGRILLATGDPHGALSTLHHSASIQRRMGDSGGEADSMDAVGEVFQALERFDEAIDFHRRAVALYRQVGDPWRTAVALGNLGAALDHAGAGDEAIVRYQEAMELTADYTDLRAETLRIRIATVLNLPRS